MVPGPCETEGPRRRRAGESHPHAIAFDPGAACPGTGRLLQHREWLGEWQAHASPCSAAAAPRDVSRAHPATNGASATARGQTMSEGLAVSNNGGETAVGRPHAWPQDARERGDFYHHPRVIPEGVREWRDALFRRVREDPSAFPAILMDAPSDEVRSSIDDGLARLREITRLVELLHGTPDLGNKVDPLDELVYIILSRKTREDAYQQGFAALKKRFRRWEDVLDAPRTGVSALIEAGGLVERKTDSLFGALQMIRERFGSCTLEPLRELPDDEVETFLCSLPEISRKSAYCVMMYSLGRQVLPVDTHVGRVLTRLGIFRELGVQLDGLDHKQLQAVLPDLVPPRLRHSLHVNLVVHGREVCKSVAPDCPSCELRNLCQSYRRAQVATARTSTAPRVIDLFCGAGGLSEGLSRAGFHVVAAADIDPLALRTLALNHPSLPPEAILSGDIRELDPRRLRKLVGRRRLDVLAGAPPCQGFSSAGFRSKSTRTGYRAIADERNYLFEWLVGIALELEPRLFLMENVPGMKSARRQDISFLEAASRRLVKGGYRTAIWQLNAAAYGVPQERTRCFLVAAAGGVELPAQPAEEYQNTRAAFDVDALPPVTLTEAIFDLPAAIASAGTAVERWNGRIPDEDVRLRRYLSKFRLREPGKLIYNHHARYQNDQDLELYGLLRPGEDSVHAIERHGRADLMRYRRDVFDDKYFRLRGDRPSKTIVSHLAKDGNGYIHPSQTRGITPREAARLQSFRDRYAFCGSPTDQWSQIGNAVPPVMAEAIARTFMAALRRG